MFDTVGGISTAAKMLKSTNGEDLVVKGGGRLVRGGGTDEYGFTFAKDEDGVVVGDNADKSIAASVRCVKD